MIPTAHPIMCGLDVHRKSISATLLIAKDNAEPESLYREFSAFTPGLLELRDWLLEHHCPIATMESSCIYWKPPFAVLEQAGILPQVVNPYDVKAKKGKKSDQTDSYRIAHLAMHNLVLPSYIPIPVIRELRLLTRERWSLLSSFRKVKNRITLLLDQCNIKFSAVATDLFGVSGWDILQKLANEINPEAETLASCARGVLKKKHSTLLAALTGTLTDTHRFLLKRYLKEFVYFRDEILAVQERIEKHILTHKLESWVQLLISIPGIKRVSATSILAEIGVTIKESFPSPQQFASWAGLCPGMDESAGKKRTVSIRKANRYLKTMLVQISWASLRKKDSPFKDYFKRIRSRRGTNRALIALAHKILRIIYMMFVKQEMFNPDKLKGTNASNLETGTLPNELNSSTEEITTKELSLGLSNTIEVTEDLLSDHEQIIAEANLNQDAESIIVTSAANPSALNSDEQGNSNSDVTINMTIDSKSDVPTQKLANDTSHKTTTAKRPRGRPPKIKN